MKLLKSQKNQVLDAIEKAGLAPNIFILTEPRDETGITVLKLKDTNYYFHFSTTTSKDHYARYSPGRETITEEDLTRTWGSQLLAVKYWLHYLNRELATPDKWKLLEEEIKNLGFEEINYKNEKFTHQEYIVIETKIDELKSKINSLNLMEEQILLINKKLDHLLKLTESMNKVDWKELFIGSMISLFMQLSIDSQTGNSLFTYLRTFFISLIPVPK